VAAVTPTPRRRALHVLVAGVALTGAAWTLAPASSPPPLYDGLTGPAEAYRYLNPPPGTAATAAPTSGSTSLAVANGSSAAGYLQTSEQPPQAQFLAGEGALSVPAGTTSVTLQLRPVPPPAPLPASAGRLDGNTYEVSATANVPGPVTVKVGGTQPTVVLRGPPGSSGAVIHRWETGGSWQALHTVPLGGQAPDMVAANSDQLGWFAMVLSGSGTSGGGSGGGSGGFPVLAVVLPVAVLALLAAVILPVRLARSRRPQYPTRRR
jgi:hypothetical protein